MDVCCQKNTSDWNAAFIHMYRRHEVEINDFDWVLSSCLMQSALKCRLPVSQLKAYAHAPWRQDHKHNTTYDKQFDGQLTNRTRPVDTYPLSSTPLQHTCAASSRLSSVFEDAPALKTPAARGLSEIRTGIYPSAATKRLQRYTSKRIGFVKTSFVQTRTGCSKSRCVLTRDSCQQTIMP